MGINSFKKIRKVFIVSAGRCGSHFFGKNLKKLSKYFYSIHEPDKISFRGENKKELWFKLINYGIWNLIILKALAKSGSRNLSLLRLKTNKNLNINHLWNWLYKDRKLIDFYKYQIYFEANAQLFGLVSDLIKMPRTKVAIFIRDPRTWVQSWLNKGTWYDEKDILGNVNWLGFKRLTPRNVGRKNTMWKSYDRFQKLCWVWNYMNSNFYKIISKYKKNIRFFLFEDFFIKKKEDIIKDFLRFIIGNNYTPKYLECTLNLLQQKENQTLSKKFPAWEYWNKQYAINLHSICGELMQKFGYGKEEKWLKKLY